MSVRWGWFAFLLGLVLAALGVIPLTSRWVLGALPSIEGPAAPSGEGAGTALVCYGRVDLEHGCTALYPLQPGRVARILVSENEEVPAGAPLLVLEDETARARVEEARAAADAAAAQRDELKAGTRPEEVEQARAALEEAQARRDLLFADAQRAQRAGAGVSPSEMDKIRRSVQEAEAILKNRKASLRLAELGPRQEKVQAAEAEAAVAQARRRQAERSLAECTLRAPQAGIVARLLVTPGAVLAPPPQQPAVLFFADEPRVVRAELEQEFAFRVAVGQAVRIQDDVGGELIGTGRVVRLSDWYLPRRSISLEPVRPTAGRTLECLIRLEPGHAPVRIGQQVRVTGMRRPKE